MTGTPFPADMIALLRWMTSCLGGTLVPMGTGTRLGMSARVQMDQLFDRYCSLDDRYYFSVGGRQGAPRNKCEMLTFKCTTEQCSFQLWGDYQDATLP